MKKYWKGLSITLAALVLAACGTPSSSSSASSSAATTLSAITITGANDVSVEFDADFNFLTGVTATGNNGQDFTSSITLSSISTAVNTTSGVLDTTRTGVHTVQYRVQSGTIVATKFRNVTVEQPESTGGMLLNPDFALGTAGWSEPANGYFELEGGTFTSFASVNGELKMEVVAGTNPVFPRFGQMNIPFELGKTYEVSFHARAEQQKDIALQVGELLPAAPWFNNFLPSAQPILYRTITTTMQRFSYKFQMNQNNQKGGILFGLGNVNGRVNTTLYFDNIEIVESTLDQDTEAPIFNGIYESVSVEVGNTFDPLNGITALDVVDGDLTDEIIVEILDGNGAKVNSVDTSAPGTYTITYTVEDLAGNEATATTTLSVVSLQFKNENLLMNGGFEEGFGISWDTWNQEGTTVEGAVNTLQSFVVLTTTGGGSAPWAIQMFQNNVNLTQGTTYRLSVTGFSSVVRKFSVGIGYDPGSGWNEYARKNGIEFQTTTSTQDFIFTVTKPSAAVKLVLELGNQDAYADGSIRFDEVRLQRLEAAPLVSNSQFALSGWRGYGSEGNEFTAGVVNGQFEMTITKQETNNIWDLQIVQDTESLVGISGVNQFLDLAVEKTYTLSFDAYASEPVTITPNIFGQNLWSNHVQSPASNLTTFKQTFTKVVSTVGKTLNDTEKLAFEFGTGFTLGANPVKVYLDNVSLKEGQVDVPTLYNGNMETVLGGHAISGDSTFVHTSSGALMTVNSMGAAWEPHYFYTFPTLQKGNYEVKFVVTGNVSRDIRFNVVLPNQNYDSILPTGFIDFAIIQDVGFTFTASFEVVNTLNNVKLEVDFGNLGDGKTSVVGSFLISEVLVYRNFNS
jgi:hypothetical protein